MNIYKVVEDGDAFCIRAETMSKAISICEDNYIEDLEDEFRKCGEKFDRDGELKYYHDSIIESCELLGELKN